MAILCQALTVILKVETIEAHYPDGLKGFMDADSIRVCDGILAGVGFMTPDDVGYYINELTMGLGLTFVDKDMNAIDFVVVDQNTGPTSECDWVEQGLIDGVRWAWMGGGEPGDLVAYEGWTKEIYDDLQFTPNEEVPNMVFEETGEPGVRKMINPEDGSESFVAGYFKEDDDQPRVEWSFGGAPITRPIKFLLDQEDDD